MNTTKSYADLINYMALRLPGKAGKKAVLVVVRQADAQGIPLGELWSSAQGAFESLGIVSEELFGL